MEATESLKCLFTSYLYTLLLKGRLDEFDYVDRDSGRIKAWPVSQRYIMFYVCKIPEKESMFYSDRNKIPVYRCVFNEVGCDRTTILDPSSKHKEGQKWGISQKTN